MSEQLGNLVNDLLNRFMGEIVAKVGYDLFTFGTKPIPLIVKSTNLPRSQVIECLRALLKYDLATFEPSKNESTADYRLISENVLLFLRYPRYLLEIKSKYGTEAELIVEETLQNGMITASRLLLDIAKKYKDDQDKNITLPALRDTLVSLANAGYVRPAPAPQTTDADGWGDVPVLLEHPVGPHAPVLPEVDVKTLAGILEGNAEEAESKPDDVHWRVHFERFHQDFRDELMIKAISRSIDDNAAEVMRHLLLLTHSRSPEGADCAGQSGRGAPITALDLRDSCRRAGKEFPLLVQYLDQYMKTLEDNSAGMVRVTGGAYLVERRVAAARLTWELVELSVQQRLGHDAARIFRLIRTKKYIEEGDIQRHALQLAKEAKQLTYQLMSEYYVSVQPMRKAATSGGGPTKAVYLYHIDLYQTARAVRRHVQHALYNAGARAAYERRRHRRLLDKQRRVETIVHGMRLRGDDQQNIDDIQDTITPPEQQVIVSIHKMLKQLSAAELQLDKALFVLEWYFMYKP